MPFDLWKIKGQITKRPTVLPNLELLLPILHTIVGVRHKTWGKEQNQLFQGCPVLPSSLRTCYIAALHSHMRCWWMRPCGLLTAPIRHQTRHCERLWFQRFDRWGAGARDWTNNHLSSASPEPRLPRREGLERVCWDQEAGNNMTRVTVLTWRSQKSPGLWPATCCYIYILIASRWVTMVTFSVWRLWKRCFIIFWNIVVTREPENAAKSPAKKALLIAPFTLRPYWSGLELQPAPSPFPMLSYKNKEYSCANMSLHRLDMSLQACSHQGGFSHLLPAATVCLNKSICRPTRKWIFCVSCFWFTAVINSLAYRRTLPACESPEWGKAAHKCLIMTSLQIKLRCY